MQELLNKKIGIWGLGIVGQSALKFVQQYTNHIQILDKKYYPEYNNLVQTPETIAHFLQNNDFIIASPGVALHDYAVYQDKFICELDLFASHYLGSSIAITGTVGKTTITSYLSQYIPNALAAGNIGLAMLDAINTPAKTTILELSSYQLHYTQTFAPDIAILANFYPNHLDHHQSIEEYFAAKCNIFTYQLAHQIALIPAELLEKIQNIISIKSKIYLFAQQEPTVCAYPTFYIKDDNLVLQQNSEQVIIYKNIHTLPDSTFLQNWIIILATLYLNKINLNTIDFYTVQPQEHRVEFVRNINNTVIYNDSKSTIWQSTLSAISKFPHKKIALFLGGLSKGTDRAPLIQQLDKDLITVFTFGHEAQQLSQLCKQNNISYFISQDLDQAVQLFMLHQSQFDILLFSPAGSSFDLFKDYKDRGNYFKQLMNRL